MAIVYQHRRKDTNEIFYIGVGKDYDRAYSHKSRNKDWHSIVKNFGYEVDILINGCKPEEAIQVEIGMIKDYGRADLGLGPLVNKTDGGQGAMLFGKNNGMFGKGYLISGEKHPQWGKPSWNSGLSKETDDRIKKFSGKNNGMFGKNKKENNPMYGKKRELCPTFKTIWINNGIIGKRLKNGETIPIGFIKGRLKNKN